MKLFLCKVIFNLLKRIILVAEDTEDKSCLVILFLGNYIDKDKIIFSRENDYILTKDIWSPFTSYQCPNLKDKPKIFIFQVRGNFFMY